MTFLLQKLNRSKCMSEDVSLVYKAPTEHSHVPNPNRLHVIRFKNEVKTRGASSDQATSTILFDALRTISLTITLALPI